LAMRTRQPEITMPEEIRVAALKPIEAMLRMSA
ncbi:MAG: quinolinate synthase NadA, partial [Cyanobacteria bacterium P01_A01_bin.17]